MVKVSCLRKYVFTFTVQELINIHMVCMDKNMATWKMVFDMCRSTHCEKQKSRGETVFAVEFKLNSLELSKSNNIL
jgi:hypothetical protein